MSTQYDNERAVNLVKAIRKLDYLHDVTLVAGVDEQKFPVHRNVMMASSPYFEALLGLNFKERHQNEIPLIGIDGPTLKTIIDYCYGCVIEINDKNAECIIAAASSMELIDLEKKCSDFFIENADVSSCIDYLTVADKYNLEELWEKTLSYIHQNFDQIATADMMRLDEKQIQAVLRADTFTAAEDEVFEYFVQWVKHDEVNRSQCVPLLANYIRLEHISPGCLFGLVEPFYEKHGCVKLVIDEYRQRTLAHKTKRLCRSTKTMYCAAYNDREIDIHEYNDDSNEFANIRTIESEIEVKNVIYTCGKIIVFGHGLVAQSIDFITCEKENLPHLPFEISKPLVVAGKYVYVFGQPSNDEEEDLMRCARFDVKQKLWHTIESLPRKIACYSAVESNGMIFAVCGKESSSAQHSWGFWCYDPSKNIWTRKAHIEKSIQTPRLFKAKRNICFFNDYADFQVYDSVLDRWNMIESILHGPILIEWNGDWANVEEYIGYKAYNTVNFGSKTYGIFAVKCWRLAVFDPELFVCRISLSTRMEFDSRDHVYLFTH